MQCRHEATDSKDNEENPGSGGADEVENPDLQRPQKLEENVSGDDDEGLPKLQTYSVPCTIRSKDSPTQVQTG